MKVPTQGRIQKAGTTYWQNHIVTASCLILPVVSQEGPGGFARSIGLLLAKMV